MATAYLDHAATTPLRPEARAAMEPLIGFPGNPSGMHSVARRALSVLDDARERMALALGCDPGELVFTSGGTEADNLALSGTCAALDTALAPGAVICSAVEHEAVMRPAKRLGAAVAPVQGDGVIDLDRLASLLHPGVVLVSVMAANHEVGSIQPVAEVAKLVRELAPGAVLHVDAVHAVPQMDVAPLVSLVDLMSISAHKFGGPQGAGALFVRRGVRISSILLGGAQERGLRAGTPALCAIAGMAAALEATTIHRGAEIDRMRALRNRLGDGLQAAIDGLVESGRRAAKVAGSCHVRIEGVNQEEMLLLLDEAGVQASAGAACASGALEPSHVLLAMGIDEHEARSALRFSLGWTTTENDVDLALQAVPEAVSRLRRSTLWP